MENMENVLNAFAMPIEQGLEHLATVARDRNCVMIGEQSHGTQEHYQHRVDLCKRLIAKAERKVFVVLEVR